MKSKIIIEKNSELLESAINKWITDNPTKKVLDIQISITDDIDNFDHATANIKFSEPPAVPVGNAANGFVVIAGSVNAGTDNDTIDVKVGTVSAGLTEDIVLEYKVSAINPGIAVKADGSVGISKEVSPEAVVLNEIVLATVATDKLWLRAVNSEGAKSAWVDFGGDPAAA